MKKNKAMRAAGVLVIATLLTTCLTAGTFAKYTTTDTATDSARVAKFGVTVVANGSLYGNAYTTKDANSPEIQTNANKDTITVKAANDTDKVVAPGTKNDSGIGFAVNGTPEVDVEITATVKAEDIFLKKGDYGVMVQKPAGVVTAENFAKLKANEELYTLSNGTYTKANAYTDTTYYVLQNAVTVSADYYPVVYTYDSANNADDTTGTITEIAAKVAGKLGTVTTTTEGNETTYTVSGNTVKNNTNLATALNLGSEKITWEWAFTGEGQDAKDTILGDLQSDMTNGAVVVKNGETTYKVPTAGTEYNLNTSFEVSISVDQVD